jgi:CheY-like chemotaxis protein
MLKNSLPKTLSRTLDLARVLLVQEQLAPRLTLKTLLEAGGYSVDVAATPAEALSKLDEGRYELVISDAAFDNRPAGRNVLAYARVKDYRPATALLTSYEPSSRAASVGTSHEISIQTEDVPVLLGEVAELIGARASRRHRPFRHTTAN